MFNWLLTAFSKADATIRSRIANPIKAAHDLPRPSIRKIVSEWTNKSTASMLSFAAHVSGSYLESNIPKDDIAAHPDREDYWIERSKILMTFQNEIEFRPEPNAHIAMMNTILGLLQETHVDLADALPTSDFFEKFRDAVTSYVESCAKWFTEQKFDTFEQYEKKRFYRATWYSNTYPNDAYRDRDNNVYEREQEHKDMISAIIKELEHNQVPDEVVLFVLTPSLASAGYEWIDNAHFPTYVNFMPINWYFNNRDEIWSRRMNNKFTDDEEYYDPADVDDSKIAELESTEAEDLNDFNFSTIDVPEPGSSSSKRPPMDETPASSSSKRSKRRTNKDKAKEEPTTDDNPSRSSSPPPDPQQPPPPQIPDDASYVPDPFLSRKARDITNHFQSLTKMDMIHDHMTRFSTTVEQPFPLTRWQVRKTDSRTFAGQSTMSRMYVITYTRKSRKPIFNPVD
jgi:hypothetical protein